MTEIIQTLKCTAESLYEPLAWDSHHFGFPVARITDSELSDEDLCHVLRHARENNVRLVYWAAQPGRCVPDIILSDFSGILVDRKATLCARLSDIAVPARQESDSVRLKEFAQGRATHELISLGVSAGAYSRFALDPRIPREKFVELYRTWVVRSALREIADVVLVCEDTRAGCTAGMITVSSNNGRGQIGLVAVDERRRGCGIGYALVAGAVRWMRLSNLNESTVVTQLANVRACRLYTKCGFGLKQVSPFFHFWIGPADGA